MPAARLTVLLANQHEGWHQTVRGLLEPQGVVTLSARSGREALQLMERDEVHVAVLDQAMPQLGGMQVVRLMKSLPVSPPAILLSDDVTPNFMQDALNNSVFSVLKKPVDFNQLLDTLARVVKRKYDGRWPG